MPKISRQKFKLNSEEKVEQAQVQEAQLSRSRDLLIIFIDKRKPNFSPASSKSEKG